VLWFFVNSDLDLSPFGKNSAAGGIVQGFSRFSALIPTMDLICWTAYYVGVYGCIG
jgi:hypothetical protein